MSESKEYRVLWQRKGQEKKRSHFQTREGAIACAERQRTAREEMTWLSKPLAALVFGPVIEERAVGLWEPFDAEWEPST